MMSSSTTATLQWIRPIHLTLCRCLSLIIHEFKTTDDYQHARAWFCIDGFKWMVLLTRLGGSIVLLVVVLITWCHASLNTTESIICHLRKGRVDICENTRKKLNRDTVPVILPLGQKMIDNIDLLNRAVWFKCPRYKCILIDLLTGIFQLGM